MTGSRTWLIHGGGFDLNRQVWLIGQSYFIRWRYVVQSLRACRRIDCIFLPETSSALAQRLVIDPRPSVHCDIGVNPALCAREGRSGQIAKSC